MSPTDGVAPRSSRPEEVRLPAAQARTPGLYIFLSFVWLLVVFAMVVADVNDAFPYVLLAAVFAVISALTFLGPLIVRYRVVDGVLYVKHFWAERAFVLGEYRVEVERFRGGLRTGGVSADNYNYGWYQVNGRPCFVIGTYLGGDVVFLTKGDRTFAVTPTFPEAEVLLRR